jgi:hypothetical protein
MNFLIVTETGHQTVATVAEVEALGYPLTGVSGTSRVVRQELQGQPTFEGLCGPMWQNAETLRYETWKAYELYSR